MRILSYDVPKNWNYFLYGDSHIGARLRHNKGFLKMVDMINSSYDGIKKNFAIDHGDMIEAITVDDKRFSLWDHRKQTVLSQINAAIKELTPIKDNLFAILEGNHERKLHNFGPIAHHISKELGVSFGTSSCHITFKHKGKLQFKHYAFHGAGSISSIADDPERRKLNWRLSLKRKLRNKFGDTLLNSMGHTHKMIVYEPTKELYLNEDGSKIQHHYTEPQNADYIHPDYRWYINTGSFLRLYSDVVVEDNDVPIEQSKLGSGYAESAGYDPIVLGFVVVKIRDNKIDSIVPEYL